MGEQVKRRKVLGRIRHDGLVGLSFVRTESTVERTFTVIKLPYTVTCPAGYELHVTIEALPPTRKS